MHILKFKIFALHVPMSLLIMQEWCVQANDGLYVNKIRRRQQTGSTVGAKHHSHSQENALMSSSGLAHLPTVSGATACVHHIM